MANVSLAGLGLRNQGVQCQNGECGLNVHHNCAARLPDTCGSDFTERRGRLRLDVDLRPAKTAGRWLLKICIHEGKNLLAKNINGLSDPYLSVGIVPEADVWPKQRGTSQMTYIKTIKLYTSCYRNVRAVPFVPVNLGRMVSR